MGGGNFDKRYYWQFKIFFKSNERIYVSLWVCADPIWGVIVNFSSGIGLLVEGEPKTAHRVFRFFFQNLIVFVSGALAFASQFAKKIK
jgi:hypothetical protein